MKYLPDDYEAIDKIALQVRMDYGCSDERLDVLLLAKKIGIVVTPYSKLTKEQMKFIKSKEPLRDGFTIRAQGREKFKTHTFYNDGISTYRQRFTITHEIKHVIFQETDPNEKQEDTANHFARQLLAPTCLVINYLDGTSYEVASAFDISIEAADYALNSARKRMKSNFKHLNALEKDYVDFVKNKAKPEPRQWFGRDMLEARSARIY